MKQVNLIPNLITAFGLACGLFVIFKINLTYPGSGIYELLHASVLILLVAAFADLLDGAIARVIHAESKFGVMFDSLADAVSFGVAPSVLMLKSLSLEQGTSLSFFAIIGAMLFSICGVLRLVRFSVKTQDVNQSEEEKLLQKKSFTGLPIPAAALTAIAVNLFLHSPNAQRWFGFSFLSKTIILTCLMIILAYFMISRWKFPSFKTFHIRVPSFHFVFVAVILAIFILYGILYYFSLVFTVLALGYFVLGLALSMIRLIAGKKSKRLKEFEIDHDEHE